MNEVLALGNVQATFCDPVMVSAGTHIGSNVEQKVAQREPEVTWKGWHQRESKAWGDTSEVKH